MFEFDEASRIDGRTFRSLLCRVFNHSWEQGYVPPELHLSAHYEYWICKWCKAETDCREDVKSS